MNVLVINCGSSSLKYQLIDSGQRDYRSCNADAQAGNPDGS